MVTRIRSVIVLGLVAFVIGLGLPRPAHALPIHDWKTIGAQVLNVLAQVGDGYVAMKKWRDEMLDKAKWADQQAQALLDQRRDIERMAEGELAGIGKGIPDWREYANVCEYDLNGVTVCNVDQRGQATIQQVVRLASDTLQQVWFNAADSIQMEIDILVGETTSPFIQRLTAAGEHPLNQLERMHAQQATSGANLDSLSTRLDSLVDTIRTEEDLDNMVSSGRANQLAAHISITEALADTEITRQQVQQLKVRTIDVLDRMYMLRRDASVVTTGRW